MFPGQQSYPEGRFQPERGFGHNWHVWCSTGALHVLQGGEYLALKPGEKYTINFANGSAARISPSHPLWQKLAEVAGTHKVEVFQLSLKGGYVPWTGNPDDLADFDAICITAN